MFTFFTAVSSVMPNIEIRRFSAVLYSVRFCERERFKKNPAMHKNVLRQVPFDFRADQAKPLHRTRS